MARRDRWGLAAPTVACRDSLVEGEGEEGEVRGKWSVLAASRSGGVVEKRRVRALGCDVASTSTSASAWSWPWMGCWRDLPGLSAGKVKWAELDGTAKGKGAEDAVVEALSSKRGVKAGVEMEEEADAEAVRQGSGMDRRSAMLRWGIRGSK